MNNNQQTCLLPGIPSQAPAITTTPASQTDPLCLKISSKTLYSWYFSSLGGKQNSQCYGYLLSTCQNFTNVGRLLKLIIKPCVRSFLGEMGNERFSSFRFASFTWQLPGAWKEKESMLSGITSEGRWWNIWIHGNIPFTTSVSSNCKQCFTLVFHSPCTKREEGSAWGIEYLYSSSFDGEKLSYKWVTFSLAIVIVFYSSTWTWGKTLHNTLHFPCLHSATNICVHLICA